MNIISKKHLIKESILLPIGLRLKFIIKIDRISERIKGGAAC